MYCPRCSTEFQETSSDAVYCRNCGLELAPVAEILGSGSQAPALQTLGPNGRLMRFGMGLFVLGVVIALANAALAGDLGLPEVYGKTIFLLIVASGLACIGLAVILPRRRYRDNKTVGPSEPNLLQTTAITTDLRSRERDFAVPSVTEETTRNLR